MRGYTNPQGNIELCEGDIRIVVYSRSLEVHRPSEVKQFPRSVSEGSLIKNFSIPPELARQICDEINP